MHTCIHAYMHTCTHAYMHACIHARMHTCTHACMHAYISTYVLTLLDTKGGQNENRSGIIINMKVITVCKLFRIITVWNINFQYSIMDYVYTEKIYLQSKMSVYLNTTPMFMFKLLWDYMVNCWQFYCQDTIYFPEACNFDFWSVKITAIRQK
jgi:hypothetical protein